MLVSWGTKALVALRAGEVDFAKQSQCHKGDGTGLDMKEPRPSHDVSGSFPEDSPSAGS